MSLTQNVVSPGKNNYYKQIVKLEFVKGT